MWKKQKTCFVRRFSLQPHVFTSRTIMFKPRKSRDVNINICASISSITKPKTIGMSTNNFISNFKHFVFWLCVSLPGFWGLRLTPINKCKLLRIQGLQPYLFLQNFTRNKQAFSCSHSSNFREKKSILQLFRKDPKGPFLEETLDARGSSYNGYPVRAQGNNGKWMKIGEDWVMELWESYNSTYRINSVVCNLKFHWPFFWCVSVCLISFSVRSDQLNHLNIWRNNTARCWVGGSLSKQSEPNLVLEDNHNDVNRHFCGFESDWSILIPFGVFLNPFWWFVYACFLCMLMVV